LHRVRRGRKENQENHCLQERVLARHAPRGIEIDLRGSPMGWLSKTQNQLPSSAFGNLGELPVNSISGNELSALSEIAERRRYSSHFQPSFAGLGKLH
jgi:hypothetical protein